MNWHMSGLQVLDPKVSSWNTWCVHQATCSMTLHCRINRFASWQALSCALRHGAPFGASCWNWSLLNSVVPLCCGYLKKYQGTFAQPIHWTLQVLEQSADLLFQANAILQQLQVLRQRFFQALPFRFCSIRQAVPQMGRLTSCTHWDQPRLMAKSTGFCSMTVLLVYWCHQSSR